MATENYRGMDLSEVTTDERKETVGISDAWQLTEGVFLGDLRKTRFKIRGVDAPRETFVTNLETADKAPKWICISTLFKVYRTTPNLASTEKARVMGVDKLNGEEVGKIVETLKGKKLTKVGDVDGHGTKFDAAKQEMTFADTQRKISTWAVA
jgi:hypothetical protein